MDATENIDERIDSLSDDYAKACDLLADAGQAVTDLYAELRRQEVEALTTTGALLPQDAGEDLRKKIDEAEATERKLAQHVELLDAAIDRLHAERQAAEPTEADRLAYYQSVIESSENRLAKALGEYLTAVAKRSHVPVGLLDVPKLVMRLRNTHAYQKAEQTTLEEAPL